MYAGSLHTQNSQKFHFFFLLHFGPFGCVGFEPFFKVVLHVIAIQTIELEENRRSCCSRCFRILRSEESFRGHSRDSCGHADW